MVIGYTFIRVRGIELADSERIIIEVSKVLSGVNWLGAIVAGLIVSGILAATMSTADSQLLAAASSMSENIVHRFIAKNIITVCTSDVESVLALMGRQSELLKKGIVLGGANQWENPVEFRYEGLNEIKPSMIEEATMNAREAAQKFAKDSGSRLGKIKTANQGTFTIENRDSSTPYIKKIRVVTSVTYYLDN